ncbi:uncharacterized protein LOC124648938 [Lolium rigidum]|uniref:uncharacterized protein LOC124648938 n=1 Tax=Lolium rigidum TaxID=89674 RepID=UPI001F5CEB1D|nr:uncharacterized protein LOC124648938 [Lolium rigidum]
MAVEAKNDTLCIKRIVRCSIRISYKCASEHWALFSLSLLLYLLYRSSPGFFAFVLSSSPVIICATLLLGILLSYGSTHLPETDEDRKTATDFSAPRFGCCSRGVYFESHRGFSVPDFKENTVSFSCWEIGNPSFGKDDKLVELDEVVPLLKGSVDRGYERVDADDSLAQVLAFNPSVVTLQQEVGMEEFMKANHDRESKDPFFSNDRSTGCANSLEDVDQGRVDEKDATFGLCSSSENERENGVMLAKENQDKVLTDSQCDSVREASEDKPAEKPAGACKWGRAFSVRQRKKLDGLVIEAINIDVGSQLDSSLGSPCARFGSHDGSSGFDSGKPESPSSDITASDVAPVLGEIGPLLGDELSSPIPTANGDSGCDSSLFPQDSQIDRDNNNKVDTSKAENDAKDGQEKKDDGGNKTGFAWTADEDKNAMDLGYSEVERSRRLEFLMAKRRSRKNIMFDLDRNMIDINGNDVSHGADRFSRFRMQVQPISVPRRSPFDLASDPDEAAIPGSAPSVMHRGTNLFELPSEQSNDSGVSAHHNLDSQGAVTSSRQDMVFRRRDTFNFGSQDRQRSRFKPCSVLKEMDIEEESTNSFQRQFSNNSISKLSVVSESDTLSTVADQEELNDLVKKDFQRWFSDKSMSKLSIVSESDTLSLAADQEEHDDVVIKDIQRWFSDKSMSKLSIVSESDTHSLVTDQEEHSGHINKEFLWYFQRQFSDKSVSKVSVASESGTLSLVADQAEHSDFNKDFLWYFQRQFSDKSVSKQSVAAESDILSSVADANQEDHDDPTPKDFLCGHASPELLRQESDLDTLEERPDVINLADGETLSAVTSGVESEQLEDTAASELIK